MDLQQATETYLADGAARLSQVTQRNYRARLRDFLRWLDENDRSTEFGAQTLADANAYLTARRALGDMPGTLNQRVLVLHTFGRRLVELGLLDSNPYALLRAQRMGRRLPQHVLREADMEALLAASHDGLDRLLVLLLGGCGLRAGDMLALRWSDFDPGPPAKLYVRGKGDKDRVVGTPPRVVEALREQRNGDLDTAHIIGCAYSSVHRRIAQMGRTALGRPIHPHLLRHSFATAFLRRGGDLGLLQQTLGHSSLAMTAVYLHYDAEDLAAAARFSPLG